MDVGVADPTRHGRLPTGEDHFTRGKAAAMMVHRKKCTYGRLLHTYYYALRKTVDHKAAGLEVAGGMGTKAAELINTISAEAKDSKVRLKLADWSWSAQSFSAHWLVRLSFTMVCSHDLTYSALSRAACLSLRASGTAKRGEIAPRASRDSTASL